MPRSGTTLVEQIISCHSQVHGAGELPLLARFSSSIMAGKQDVSVENLSENKLAERIKKLLVDGEHLTNPHVKVRRINSKFTVLGEVRNPGTFSYYDRNLNIFQALGYAGDITITGKRKNITLIREENGMRKVYDISLSKSELLNKPYYLIKNNDVIMVKPNFSKVKSAGFIGSPASIASVASLLLSVTLLILNK